MFTHGSQTMGIVCLVTILCGFGLLIAFVYGWMKVGEWKNLPVMGVWTACSFIWIPIMLLQVMGEAFGDRPPAKRSAGETTRRAGAVSLPVTWVQLDAGY